MIGRGGNDMQARESMFAAQATDFKSAPLLATTRTGADDKFDPAHPFYRLIADLSALRSAHPALRTGAMLPRVTNQQDVFAFSRIERSERVEYLAVFNNSRSQSLTALVPTSQQPGARMALLFASHAGVSAGSKLDGEARASVSLPPMQFGVWRAELPLAQTSAATIRLVNPAPGAALKFTKREIDGLVFPSRVEIRADVAGGDGLGEVTFSLERASRPGQIEYLGTDDAAPYRVFWRPPHDLAPGEKLTLTATHHDLRGRLTHTQVSDVVFASAEVPTGIVGAKVPLITRQPVKNAGALSVEAQGTGPLEYQWLRNGEEIAGATRSTLTFKTPAEKGVYRVLVRNRAGTTLSAEAVVE